MRRLLVNTLVVIILAGVGTAAAQDFPTCDPNSPLSHGDPSTSPDGRYTVYFECYAPGETIYTVYVYDHEMDDTDKLGETVRDLETENIFTARWLPDDRVAFRTETGGGTYNWRSVYIADAARAGSLREIARDYVSRPRYGDKPPRYEWAVEDGLSETFTVYRYEVGTGQTDEIYSASCELRDELNSDLSCHMVTPNTNNDFTEGDDATRIILNIGDSAREFKTVEVRALPSGDLLYAVEALGSGYGEWLQADTVAIFNISFVFEPAGFGGLFVQFDDEGAVINEEPFVLPNGAEMTLRPSWMEGETVQ